MTRSPAAASRIHESLDTALARKRVVLWYDPSAEWASEFEGYQQSSAEKLRVEGNFLLYLPSAKPFGGAPRNRLRARKSSSLVTMV